MTSNRLETRFVRAFTHIELLVVVAIIAMLISIILPSLGLARKQARQVLCSTNLRNMGQAGLIYAGQNRETIVRAEQRGVGQEMHFVSCLLPGLGYDGRAETLWTEIGDIRPFTEVCRDTKSLQCPDFPVPEQALDYVVSSFATVYTRNNVRRDVTGGGSSGDQFRNEFTDRFDTSGFFRLSEFGKISPATITYISEAHASLPTSAGRVPTRFEFHDFFITSQIPFGAFPRVSNDRRHPGGIGALFFDGHAEIVPWKKFDPGWPNTLGVRLRLFSRVPPEIDR